VLYEILSEEVSEARQREDAAFDLALADSGHRLVLFGAGTFGRQALERLRACGVEPLAFSDNDSRRWGTQVDGALVLSPAEAVARFGDSALFLVTIWNNKHRFVETQRQLQGLGCRVILGSGPLRWKFRNHMLPFYWEDLPHKVLEQRSDVARAASLWADEASRREYLGQVRWRVTGDITSIGDPVSQESYFPDDLFVLSECEHFVDCGAYDGDTVREVIRRQGEMFNRIDALEPDPTNFDGLKHSLTRFDDSTRRKIHAHRLAVGQRAGVARFNASADEGSALSDGGDIEVECITLDDFLATAHPTYIKMDIEGAELAALSGAAHVISKHAPVLAICLYHTQDHLWRIPLFLRSLREDYHLFLRPHQVDGWQLVCYAVPPTRLVAR
jgi:FkbM family methyltransferase